MVIRFSSTLLFRRSSNFTAFFLKTCLFLVRKFNLCLQKIVLLRKDKQSNNDKKNKFISITLFGLWSSSMKRASVESCVYAIFLISFVISERNAIQCSYYQLECKILCENVHTFIGSHSYEGNVFLHGWNLTQKPWEILGEVIANKITGFCWCKSGTASKYPYLESTSKPAEIT